MMKEIIIGAVIIGLSVIVGIAAFGGKTVVEVIDRYSASSGPDHYNLESFYAGIVDGGDAISINGANTTLTAKQICESSVISMTSTSSVGDGLSSTTLPLADNMTSYCLRQNGAKRTFMIRNADSNSGSSTIISVSSTTAETLLISSGSTSVIPGGASVFITIRRLTPTTVVAVIEDIFKDAD